MKFISGIRRKASADGGLSYADSLGSGQRQSRREISRLASAALLCAAASLAFGAEHLLPGAARTLSFQEETGLLAASMSLDGVAFLALQGEDVLAREHHPEWQTTYALPVEDGRFLLAGRFGRLILVEPTTKEGLGFEQIASWPVEGLPTHIVQAEKRLYVASGSTGLQIFEWDGAAHEPYLRSRFPFVDFSKEIRLGKEGVIFLADNLDTGLQIMQAEDILRPVLLARKAGGYIDSVAYYEDLAAISSRREGTFVFDVSSPARPELIATIPRPETQPGLRPPVATSVEFNDKGELLVCEERGGARLLALDSMAASGWRTIREFKLPGGGHDAWVLDGIFLSRQRVALSTYGKVLAIIPIEE